MWFPPHSPPPQQEVYVQITTQQIAHLEDKPSSSTRQYDLWDRFETYRNKRSFVEISRGPTPRFQIPHTSGSLSQKAKED
jgi:hypothetical protein